jgi:peroxiredoxin
VSLSLSLYLYRTRFPDTVDPQERLSAFVKKHGISYPLLSDPDQKVQLAYGVKPIMFGLVRGTPQSQSQSQILRSATVVQCSTFCQSHFAESELVTSSHIGRETFFIDESGRIIDRHIENYAFSAM